MPEKSTWREQTRTIAPNRIISHTFNDTNPNLIILKNIGANDIFVNTTPQLSTTVFEEMIPPQGTRILHRPIPYEEVFFLSVLGTSIRISSEERAFSPSVIMQTQLITIPSGSVEYTVPGTYQWTVPSGVSSVSAFIIGGGGGGGGGSGINVTSGGGIINGTGGGGGGSASAQIISFAVNPNQNLTIIVGAGGVGGAGGSGGNFTGWDSPGSSGGAGGNGHITRIIRTGFNINFFCGGGGGGGGAVGGFSPLIGSAGSSIIQVHPSNGLSYTALSSSSGNASNGGHGGGLNNFTFPFNLSSGGVINQPGVNGNFLSCGGGGGGGGGNFFGAPGRNGGNGHNGYVSISW